MRYALFAILLVAAPRGVVALTWDFDDGNAHGWTARQHSEIIDGVWRIAPVPGQRPTVSLSSPLIGKDSALFDRLTLRLRLIHHSPTEHGELRLGWANAENGNQGTSLLQSYPIEWEEITLDLRALAADPERRVTWQDTLFNFIHDFISGLTGPRKSSKIFRGGLDPAHRDRRVGPRRIVA